MSDDLSQWFQASDDNEFSEAIELPEVKQKEEKNYVEVISREELLQMKETENLFSNELWRLTFDEMLQAIVKPTVKRSTITTFLQKLYKILSDNPFEKSLVLNSDSNIFELLDLKENDLCPNVHIFHSIKDVKKAVNAYISRDFNFGDVNIIGSFLLNSNLNKPETSIDVAVDINDNLIDLFLGEQNLNDSTVQLYYKLRYLYLIILFKILKKNLKDVAKVSWSLFRELDEMKPIIQIQVETSHFTDFSSKIKEGNTFTVNIYPTISESKREEVQANLVTYHESLFDKPSRDQSNLIHGVWEDLNTMNILNIFHELFQNAPTIIQTLCLLKVWSRLRGLLRKCDGLNGYAWTLILGHLAKRTVIDSAMSPYQIFKIAIKWISCLNQEIPIIFGEQESSDDISLPHVLSMFERGDFIVFKFETDSIFNDFHRISDISWKELKYEADLTLQFLNEGEQRIENVQSTFTTPHNHFRKYDIHIIIENIYPNENDNLIYNTPRLNIYNHLTNILYQSLQNRANSIRIIGESSEFLKSTRNIVIGIILNNNDQESFIRGPRRTGHDIIGLEKILIDRFISVWGKRAKLTDSILDEHMVYGVEWRNQPEADIVDKNSIHIIPQILNFVLKKNISDEISCRLSGEFLYDYYFIPKKNLNELKHSYDDAILQLQDALETIDVNLELQHIVGISSEFRGCALSPVILNAHSLGEEELEDFEDQRIISYGTNITPLRVVLDFHERSKWPLTPDACHQLKTFIYATYHEGLKKNGIHSRLYETHLDVFINGLVLRSQIRLQQEITRYKTSGHIKNPYVVGLDRDIVMLPVHAAFIENFIRHYPQFNHVCRLAKRWINAHLFGIDVPEPLIELLVAYSCYTSEPYRPSKSNLLCFYNFIHLIANFPWQSSPLFVNLELDPDTGKPLVSEKDQEEITKIRSEFEVTPSKSPMYIVASYAYEERNFWTKFDLPNTIILKRMIGKSKQTLKIFDAIREDDLSERVDVDSWKLLFKTSFQVFNPQINIEHLNDIPQGLYFELESIGFVEKCNLINIKDLTVNSFPALDFVRRLRQQFSNFGGFFVDPCHPNKIGVALNPDYINNASIPFELNKLNSLIPNTEKNGLQLNLEGLYEIIERMSIYNNKKAIIEDVNKKSTPKKNQTQNKDSGSKRKREPDSESRKKSRQE